MKRYRGFLVLCLLGFFGTAVAFGQEPVREGIPNWAAPAFWQPSASGDSHEISGDRARAAPQAALSSPLPFIPVSPCRQYDSRNFTPLLDNTSRTVTLSGAPCGIPVFAQAVSVNITVFNITGAPSNGVFRVGIVSPPPTAWINFPATETQRANAGIVAINGSGQIIVQVNMGAGQVDFTCDVNGYYAGAEVGAFNTFLGRFAGNSTMTGNFNSGIGRGTLTNNTTGASNTAVGEGALGFNTLGGSNTAIGVDALLVNTMGTGNTSSGFEALFSNTEGVYSTASGYQALFSNTTGTGNTAIGITALRSNIDSDFNTAIGENALYSTTGLGNIGVGVDAGFDLTTGGNNICIGAGTAGVAGESATNRIGNSFHTATFIAGISGQLSSGGIGVLVNSSGKLGTPSSSRRFKENIREIGEESDGLMRLSPVAFRYRQDFDSAGLTQYGLIAEEVAEVYPDLVAYGRGGQPEAVRYHLVNALLLNKVQKQRRTMEAQERTIEGLEARLARLEARLLTESRPGDAVSSPKTSSDTVEK